MRQRITPPVVVTAVIAVVIIVLAIYRAVS